MRSVVEGVERRLHAETALAFATLGGGFFLRRERHVTDGGERRREARAVGSRECLEVGEEGGFSDRHGWEMMFLEISQ